MNMKKFTAIVHRGEPDEGGFWATCLEVPGANGQGETREDALINIQEAIQLYLEVANEKAREIIVQHPKSIAIEMAV